MWTKVTRKNAKVGMVVKPNPKCWEWGMQGHTPNGTPKTGKILSTPTKRHLWVDVKWEDDNRNGYQVGEDRKYDLLTEVEEKRGVVCPGNVKVGLRVVRGPDWRFWNQDHVDNKPAAGTVARSDGFVVPQGWCRVKWDNGSSNNYRIGQNAQFAAGYDLYIAPEVVKEKKPTRKVVSLALLTEKDAKIKDLEEKLEGLQTALRAEKQKVWDLTKENQEFKGYVESLRRVLKAF